MKNFTPLKNKLDSLVKEKNTNKALFESPDPLQVAKFHLDAKDPIKYDFALYRLGQNKELSKLKE